MKGALRELQLLLSLVFSKADYWQIPKVMALEDEFGYRSTFNFVVKDQERLQGLNLMRFLKGQLYNPSYNIEDRLIKEAMESIRAWGGEIGLHGSYNSFDSASLLSKEKRSLETVIKERVLGVRQHFLRFSTIFTWEAQRGAGLRYDTSLAYRDFIGFRAGICYPFHPFDLKNGTKEELLEIPLVVMDGALFDREALEPEEAWQRVLPLLETLWEHEGAYCIVWHQRVFCSQDFPHWAQLYKKILDWVKAHDGYGCPIRDLFMRWEQRAGLTLLDYKRLSSLEHQWTLQGREDIEAITLQLHPSNPLKAHVTIDGPEAELTAGDAGSLRLSLKGIKASSSFLVKVEFEQT